MPSWLSPLGAPCRAPKPPASAAFDGSGLFKGFDERSTSTTVLKKYGATLNLAYPFS